MTSNPTNTKASFSEPSFMSFLSKVIETVYRCDSAAVVAGAYHCGSLSREALYQGVEVVYKCDGQGFRNAAGDFDTPKCYCGNRDDDNEQLPMEFIAHHQKEMKSSLPATNFPISQDQLLVEARNDIEEIGAAEMGAISRVLTNNISATRTFEDSILNGPNSINELSSTGSSSLLDSMPSTDAKPSNHKSSFMEDPPNTPVIRSGFCF